MHVFGVVFWIACASIVLGIVILGIGMCIVSAAADVRILEDESTAAMSEDSAPEGVWGRHSPEQFPRDPQHVVTWHPPGSLSGNAKQRRIERRCQQRMDKKRPQRIGAA